MSVVILGVDLGKKACGIAEVNAGGMIVTRRRTLIDHVPTLPPRVTIPA
ncbi:hypothetical protein SUS17_586 [Sphingomonas sp. S17]|uniref:Uncharacterized protein n=1 Tax=Sphingomonas paucimobilis TaxID=13689 RepID=A0A7Y2PF38_SPHPI|nr:MULTISPECIES: hypothetical protein [Sphingomonas]EGI56401.1 hypothetical protein SUS17_586 [Sphingomonas sp. S17]MBQ1479064.1 hypothetical protein [Sphingomonas sp.]MCM3678556.1 hypothetical protein [Sphingomonas paucimobilis]MDG5969583.1 hypothetical protein [Sphingomonas paucimobilis]NNG59498.1 hypothetical protein [Sphingomonas paucimobilis]